MNLKNEKITKIILNRKKKKKKNLKILTKIY